MMRLKNGIIDGHEVEYVKSEYDTDLYMVVFNDPDDEDICVLRLYTVDNRRGTVLMATDVTADMHNNHTVFEVE